MAYKSIAIPKDTWLLLSTQTDTFQIRTLGLLEVYTYVGRDTPTEIPTPRGLSPFRLLSAISNQFDDFAEINFTQGNGDLYVYSKGSDTIAIQGVENENANLAKIGKDFSGSTAFNTIFGEATVGTRRDYINVAFQYGISDYDTISVGSGTGSKSSSTNSTASINTGIGVGSYTITSRATNRYVTGHECLSMFTAQFSVGEINTTQRIGYGDIEDFIGFGKNADIFGIWTNLQGADFVHIPQSSWNLDKLDGSGRSGHIINPNKYNIYMITFGWLGIAPITFSVYCGVNIGWVAVHSIDITNNSDFPHLANPVMPISMNVTRTSGSGNNIELRTSSWRASIIGEGSNSSLSNRQFQLERSLTISAGVETPIISFYNKPTFQGRVNHVVTRYATVTLATDGTKDVRFKVKRNATLGGANFIDVDTNNSVSQYDVTATTISGGTLIGGTILGKSDKDRINLFGGDVVIPIYPNETVTLSAISTGGSDVSSFLRIIEEF